MELKIFFSPLDDELFSDISGHNTFYHSIRVNHESMPAFNGADIAILGLPGDQDKEKSNNIDWEAANEIRKKLYHLKKGSGTYRIIDLGNLNPGISLDETYLRIKEVCEMLIENNVLPILIGGSHDMDIGQFRAYEEMKKLVSFLNVDALLDMEDRAGIPDNTNHIHNILLHEPNFLFNYSHLGYQSYLIDPAHISLLEKLYFEAYRLGHLREHIKEMEPIIRDADMMSFDIGAIKSIDATGVNNPRPFGLTGEEACQICWYAGLNEKLSSVGFYEYKPRLDDLDRKTASVIATMIWYFVEGFYNRKSELNFKTNDYLKYVVSMPADPEAIVFYKSKLSEKWWLEVPYPDQNKYERNCIVPCNYKDYELATQGQVPDRWLNTFTKLY